MHSTIFENNCDSYRTHAHADTTNQEKILTNRIKQNKIQHKEYWLNCHLSDSISKQSKTVQSFVIFVLMLRVCFFRVAIRFELFDFEINVSSVWHFLKVMLNVCLSMSHVDWSVIYRMRIYNIVYFFRVAALFCCCCCGGCIDHSLEGFPPKVNMHTHIN